MSLTVALNSYYFLDEMLFEESHMRMFIRDQGHHILITERPERNSIRRQYEKAAVKRGLGPQLLVALDQLDVEGLIIRPNVPRRRIPNLRQYHSVFIEDAVTAGADYFVTDYGPWLRLDRNRRMCPNLRIVTGSGFFRMTRRR